jgi:EAL domain-containing protein (putative c-di-GMP-specific phosphodiesterase class I)
MATLLRDMGVDYLQGYHVHRPEAFPHWQPVNNSQAAVQAHAATATHLTLAR